MMLGILKEEKKEKKKKKMQAVEKFAPTTSNRTSSAASTSEVDGSTLISNVLIEDLATDSFQNLLFSILKYREATGVYPYHITVVTHDFKKRRFLVRVQSRCCDQSQNHVEETCFNVQSSFTHYKNQSWRLAYSVNLTR